MTDQAGQQLVPINGCWAGTFSRKSRALLDGAQVRTDGNLDHIDKAQLAHGCFQLGGAGILAKLADKRWRHTGINLPPPFHIIDNLENLTLIGNRCEWAIHQAHATGNTLIIIDLCPPHLIRLDGIHTAGRGAGPLDLADGMVRALVHAPAALDAFVLVDDAVLVLIQRDGILGADLHTRVRQTALAIIRDAHLLASGRRCRQR